MKSVISCIGESTDIDSICNISAWVAKKTSLPISLLHVSSPYYNFAARALLDNEIGIGTKSDVMRKISKIDNDHNKLEKKMGEILLAHAKEELEKKGVTPKTLSLRASLSHSVMDLEPKAELFIIGKYGAHHNPKSTQLGHNVESVAQTTHKPLLVVNRYAKNDIKSFLIAFDGSLNSQKAINYVIKSPLFKGLECHLLTVGELDDEIGESLKEAEQSLKKAGFSVTQKTMHNKLIDNTIAKYVDNNAIDLLVIGSYGESKLHTLIFGSTTTAILRKCNVPILLFR
ncbi:MAG: universal stress protein [Rickettsiales bacterium]|nr:universal stress protein [Rickettsiales bacterium]